MVDSRWTGERGSEERKKERDCEVCPRFTKTSSEFWKAPVPPGIGTASAGLLCDCFWLAERPRRECLLIGSIYC